MGGQNQEGLTKTKALQSDLDFVRDGWGLESSGSAKPCPLCKCNSTNIPWSDHRTSAAWRTNGWDDKEEWEEAHPNRAGIFDLEGLWVQHVYVDLMHTKHLGTDSYLAGSFFSYVVEFKRTADTTEEAMMGLVWTRIKETYQDPCGFFFWGGGGVLASFWGVLEIFMCNVHWPLWRSVLAFSSAPFLRNSSWGLFGSKCVSW